MDNSLFSSTLTSSSSLLPSNSHITVARKLQEISRRIRYAKQIIKGEGALHYGGCTEEKVGPPTFIKEPYKSKWREDIRGCANRCVWHYLLPDYTKRLEYYRNKINTEIESKLTVDNRDWIEKGIQKGKDRANKKWDIREGIANREQANVVKLGPFETSEIGRLKRGELPMQLGESLVLKTDIKHTKDAFRILAHAIYGSVRFSKLLIRNLWKYIQLYQFTEAKKFRPFCGKLCNNTYKWIGTWKMFVAFINNRDMLITTYELDILSRLYDVRISIFRDTSLGLRRTWRSFLNTNREVNLHISGNNEWMLLVKSYDNGVDSGLVTNQEVTISKGSTVEPMQHYIIKTSDLRLGGEINNNKKRKIAEVEIEEKDKEERLIAMVNSQTGVDNQRHNKHRKNKLKRTLWQIWRNKCRDKKRNKERKAVNLIQREDKREKKKQLVFDFTSEGLDLAEIELLSKGESFCATNHKVDVDRLKTDILNYSRRLRLYEEFREPKIDPQTQHSRQSVAARQSQRIGNYNTNMSPITQTPGLNRLSNNRNSQDTILRANRTRQSIRTTTITQQSQRISKRPPNTHILGINRQSNTNTSGNTIFRKELSNNNNNLVNTHNQQNRQTGRAIGTVQQSQRTDRYNMSPITQTPGISRLSSNVGSQNSTIRNNISNNSSMRKPASIYDPESQNRNLNRYLHCIQEESLLISQEKMEFKDNINKQHRIALKTLKKKIEDKKVVITKADKGSGLVAVDYDTYIQKGTNYIEVEAKAYQAVSESAKSIIGKLTKARNNVVQKMKTSQVIEIETATYCNKQLEEKITGLKFYYKIHKDTNILTMPLRPLQSCINAPTHHLSQVLTDILQPFLKKEYIPTYLQDSNQLLFRLGKLQKLSRLDTLISSDVAALYPSIPHEEGLQAITDFLSDNSNYSPEQIASIESALKLVITENYVFWNKQIYKQSSGVAMGTPVAVAYANIFMHWIDSEIKHRAPYIIEHIRYIDDNLFILPIDKIGDLMQVANNILYPHIRFTYDTLDRSSDKGLPFLDTLLFITEEGEIVSRLYTKSTDKHAYLLPSSYHPQHITKNIPQAVFNRIRRLCSNDEWFQADASKAIEWLEDRDYKHADIKKAIEISSKKDRTTLINNIEQKRVLGKGKTDKTDTFEIPFLVTYSHSAQKIKKVLKQRKGLLDASFTATKVRPRLTFRRQKNLSDIIIQKSLRGPITSEEEKVVRLCGEMPKYRTVCPCKGKHNQKICRCCAHIKQKVEGIKVKLHKSVDCDTKNIIYLIGCKLCNKRYVGETQQKLKERLLQHLGNITKLKQPMYIHFNQVHAAENLFISILETVNSEEIAYRRIREAWWINRLQTLEPRGFNVKLECSQTYIANQSTIRIERGLGQDRRR